MRKTFLVLSTALACLGGSALAAPPSPPPDSQGEQITAQMLDEVEDVYAFPDGRRLQLVQIDKKLYADLIRRDRVELFQVSDHVFASKDNTLTVEIKTGDFSEKEITVHDTAAEGAPVKHWRLL